MKPISATISLCLLFLVAAGAASATEPEQRRFVDTKSYSIVNDQTVPPVFDYRGPRGHHMQRISKQPIDAVLVWADGTIAWQVMKDDDRFADGWYQSTIPAEKVEKAVKAIVESFKKYPVENRFFNESIWFQLGVNHSPGVMVMTPDLYEWIWMDNWLFRHYVKNRDDFRSGDDEKMIHAMMELGNPGTTGIVDHYREHLPHAGLSKPGEKKYSDEELKKCAELFAADAEHLLVMEKQILDLVPPHDGLTPKKDDYKSQDVKVEEETVDGKRRFIYSPLTKKEKDKFLEQQRKQRKK